MTISIDNGVNKVNAGIKGNEGNKGQSYDKILKYVDTYTFRFKFLDEYITVETDSIQNIHFFIGSNIAKILDQKLK